MKLIVILTCLIFTSLSFGQINVEKYNSLNSTSNLFGNLSFYISAKTGNTDVQEFELDGRLHYNNKNYYSLVIAQGEYGWNKGIEYSNNALIHLRYINKYERIINLETFGQINYNKSKLLLFRSLLGGGIRLNISSSKNTNFTYGTSYLFEYEKLDLPINANHKSITKNHRWNNYLSISDSFSKTSRFSAIVYLQPRFNDFSDLRILLESHLGVEISNKFSVSLNFNCMYDNKPPDNIKNIDTTTKFGLSLKL